MSELKPKILCVDDEEAVLTTLEILLRSNGYEVIKASNGAEALIKIRTLHPKKEVVNTNLPGMT